MTTTDWTSRGARQFVDKRLQMRRDGPMRTLHVRAFQGVVSRLVDGRQQVERCPHAHNKQAAARACAEAAAKRLNRGTD